jgi:heat shock protein HslJ
VDRIRYRLATLLALSLTLGAATSVLAADEPVMDEGAAIEGVTWLLEQQLVDGQLAVVPGPIVASLLMADGQAGGDGGCNSWFGAYELDDDALAFGPIGSTMMACLGPAMDVEQAYLANLGNVASWAVDGLSLALADASGQVILLLTAAPEATVVGSWVAVGINDGAGGVVSSTLTPLVTAEFGPDGELSGSDGCNSYFTSYTVDGDAIAVDPQIATTKMACAEPGLDELAQQYYTALTGSSFWSVDAGGSLELRDASGALQVRYEPAG